MPSPAFDAWMEEKPGSPACNVVSGIDAHELRADVPPRPQPVSDEERADAVASSIYHAWVKQIWDALPPPPPESLALPTSRPAGHEPRIVRQGSGGGGGTGWGP